MRASLTADGRSRYVAIAAVIAVHIVLVLIVRSTVRVQRAKESADDALIWLRLEERVETPPREERRETRSRAPVEPTAVASVPGPTPQPAPQAISAPRQIDWRANAARSAQLAADSAAQEQYRSFGPRKPPPPEEPAPPSIFRDTAKHAYGDVSELGGKSVVWMSENCYTELDAPVQTARDWVIANPGSFASPAINCVGDEQGRFRLVLPNPNSFTPPSLNFTRAIGTPEADGTLFEHIKKPEEPPLPKMGTEMNELPERK